MLLATVVDQVAMECDLEECTISQYRRSEKRFSEHLKKLATDKDLTVENLNGFIAALQKRVSNRTARNYRVSITRIWNYLSKNHSLPEYNVRRLRSPKIADKPVYAWEADQVVFLLKGAQDLLGKLRCGIDESDFVTAWIWLGFDSGLRPVDMRLLRWDDINFKSKTMAIVQHKTGQSHSCMISNETIDALMRIQNPEREFVFPLSKGGCRRLELKLFREARRHGFTRRYGQGIGTLRKTHATEIYVADGIVAAAESLGHVSGIRTARSSYIDHRAVRMGRLPNRPKSA